LTGLDGRIGAALAVLAEVSSENATSSVALRRRIIDRPPRSRARACAPIRCRSRSSVSASPRGV